jgi:tyrosine recombinase xerC
MTINLLYLLGVVPDVYRGFSFMLARDIEMFIEHCGLKGLSTKTINSYEQTLRLFMQYMDEQGILLTEKITHLAIQGYIKSIPKRRCLATKFPQNCIAATMDEIITHILQCSLEKRTIREMLLRFTSIT